MQARVRFHVSYILEFRYEVLVCNAELIYRENFIIRFNPWDWRVESCGLS